MIHINFGSMTASAVLVRPLFRNIHLCCLPVCVTKSMPNVRDEKYLINAILIVVLTNLKGYSQT